MPALLISLVVPVYNVARYLPEFLDALDGQSADLQTVEVVFVNDGSTDRSSAIIKRWMRRSVVKATLIRQENAGAASARNAGIAKAAGQWLSFPDPDDRLDPDYLKVVTTFLLSPRVRKVHLVATNLLMLNDATRELTDSHPLRFKFAEGERVVSLNRQPQFIQLSGASAFYRRSPIRRAQLRFDPRVRPNFEDAHFTARYLAGFTRPTIALLPKAVYQYRRRADNSSQMQESWSLPEKYTDLLTYGYLGVLEEVAAAKGSVPLWLQNLVLYEIAFYFRADNRPNSPTGAIPAAVSRAFHDTLKRILSFIDVATIEAFRLTWISQEMRTALVIGGKGLNAVPEQVNVDALDQDRRLVRVSYYFLGDLPTEEFRARGLAIRAVHAKVRSVRFLGQMMMLQRIAWLPATGSVAITINGRWTPIVVGPAPRTYYSAGAGVLWRALSGGLPPPDNAIVKNQAVEAYEPAPVSSSDSAGRWLAQVSSSDPAGRWLRSVRAALPNRDRWHQIRQDASDAILRRRAVSAHDRRKYAHAWLLSDRDSQAQDNGERLYEYLSEHQTQINAFFVLSRSSSDWNRLERRGFRLLDYGSTQHTLALLNCDHVISSQIDEYVVNPLSSKRFGPRTWHYTFLQHGVTKDDLSVWINRKPIDLMITATPQEHESIVGDRTPYVFTTREIVMTGFPRHDRLLGLATASEDTARKSRTLIVMPTWRRDLLLDQLTGGNDRQLRDDFWETDYARQWRAVVESTRLNDAAQKYGWEVIFIPHPNMQNYLDTSPLAAHVSVRRFRDVDVQQILADAAMLVTDYSSIAFDMAYIQRPVLYFQFDQDRFFNGHAYRKGTWSYEDDGFGPVLQDAGAVVDQIVATMAVGATVEPPYARRMVDAFPLRDGQNSRRTFDAIENMTRRLTYAELHVKVRSVAEPSPVGPGGLKAPDDALEPAPPTAASSG